MITLVTTKPFEKSVKRMKKRGKDMSKLKEVLCKLENHEALDFRSKDHQLIGNWQGHRECHVEPDWLLIYRKTKTHVYLAQTGSHSDLF